MDRATEFPLRFLVVYMSINFLFLRPGGYLLRPLWSTFRRGRDFRSRRITHAAFISESGFLYHFMPSVGRRGLFDFPEPHSASCTTLWYCLEGQ